MAGEVGASPKQPAQAMNLELAEQKQALRRRMAELQGRFSADEVVSASTRLCEHLRAEPLWRNCQSVLSFFPMPGEPDVRPLLQEALAAGKRLALPRFDPALRDYEVRQVTTLSALEHGHYGILEPGPAAARLEINRLDFILVPGVAYDGRGRRLGRGKGYFDRLLAQVHGHKCGVAFDWQVVTEVPVGPQDVSVNSLLTPSRWMECAG
jgi:5-formyltetrahydrofolate cyclo-ligase